MSDSSPTKEETFETYKVKGSKKGKVHKYALRLYGGSVYYYRTTSEGKPLYAVHLNDFKLEESPDKIMATASSTPINRPGFGLSCKIEGVPVTLVSYGSSESVATWIELIKANVDTPSVFMATHQSTIDKAKKNVVGVVASSSAGKSAMKKVLAKPTRKALSACKHVIANQKGPKAAEAFENCIIKLSIKIYMLWEKGVITQKMIDSLEETARRVVRKFYIIYCNEAKVPDVEVRAKLVNRKFGQAVEFGTLLAKKVEEILIKFSDQKTVDVLNELMSIVCNQDFLREARANKANEADITLIVDTSKVLLGWEAAACENVGALYDGVFNFYG
eukprot:TRINITY_DN2900_c0_g1_i1.p1 TRINITY_DN2900_c0_g1~~TRINITY_DN2900_c0_g1_i1.p1  ORF type:complete len:332 (+),score=120.51 TRINITY_DN2900_c0_g1_i1:71-1066(+)